VDDVAKYVVSLQEIPKTPNLLSFLTSPTGVVLKIDEPGVATLH